MMPESESDTRSTLDTYDIDMLTTNTSTQSGQCLFNSVSEKYDSSKEGRRQRSGIDTIKYHT